MSIDSTSHVLDAMSDLHAQALQDGALSRTTKELIALAVSVAAGCEPSIAYHLHNALEAGATRQEVTEAVEVAVVTLDEPATIHGTRLLRALASEATEEPLHARAAAHPYMTPD